ncbi:MAG: CoA transferase [Candidatus Binatia bacterium]|nr:CoA transferase [Candidatus Binatia bacterium]
MFNSPLGHLRVVDLTDLRGALAGRLLADLGADVVKIEAPDPHADMESVAYLYRNANKRGAFLDVEGESGRERFESLCTGTDVLIENLGRERQEALGLTPKQVAERYPHLVHVSLSDFGSMGPKADWHLEPLPAFAASGALFASGFPDRPPCWLPGFAAHDCASVYGAVGALAAVMDRDRHGQGQNVEVSVQEAGIAGLNPWAIPLEDYGRTYPILPSAPPRSADGNYLVLPASDGWVRIVPGNVKHWRGLLEVLGQPEALQGEQWENIVFRMLNSDVIRVVASEITQKHTRAELFEEARKTGLPLGPVHRPEEFVACEQSKERETFVETEFPGLGDAPFCAPVWSLSETPATVRRPAPLAGQDDLEGFSPRKIAAKTDVAGAGLLLDGVRVIEFGVAAVVPELVGVLSEFGAEVIKIESRAHLDVLRLATLDEEPNRAWTFNDECRGRKSVCLDLSTEEGRKLALDLCATADVVAENHRGGVLEGLGLGYEDVAARNPKVVYFSSQGYGRGGPLDQMQAFGPLNAAFAGIHPFWNHADVPYPCGTALNHPDHIAGKIGALAVLAALDHRNKSGEGQFVEMAQTEAAAYLFGELYLEEACTGRAPEPRGNRSETAVPHDVYPCVGEDRWCAIAVSDDAAWERLVAAVGWDSEERFARAEGRVEAREEIDARLTEWTRTRPSEEVTEILQAAGVSAMFVQGPDEHRRDLHLAARGALVTLEHPEVGSARHVGNPLRLSKTPLRAAAAAPLLGADTENVLTEALGLGAAEVERLVEEGVCR